ncbi:Werner helicase interacting protein 1 [Gaertneriomyces sp. JEL0708]|nr:Werner helicase interacting protein 1 [Gaertneriomyces sp. JEL0708]
MAAVTCPVCSKHVQSSHINPHLDSGCEKHLASTESAIQASGRPTNPLFAGLGKPAQKKPKLSSTPPENGSSHVPPPLKRTGPDNTPVPTAKRPRLQSHVPLADLARPAELDDVQGHVDIIGPGSLLRSLMEQKKIPSLIFFGPPGVGKTSLARVIAKSQNTYYRELSATTHNVADVRKAADEAKNHRALTGQKPIIFLDEIHRFTKAQQDFFLPSVERGDYTLIAATTENPSFRVNNALLSRCKVFALGQLREEDLIKVLRRALQIKAQDSAEKSNIDVSDETLRRLATLCSGDARAAINTLEMAVDSILSTGNTTITEELVMSALKKVSLMYDRNGEEHYNIISALHKSMRGGDANAAVYWLGRMIYAGEDPLYVARRLVRFASEDIGLADNGALPLAVSTYQACQQIGMPECDAILAHCVTYLARAPKSVEVYQAIKRVRQTIETSFAYPVPLHIRNAPTKLMEELGYHKGYKYNPDFEGHVEQTYLPHELQDLDFFQRGELIRDPDVIHEEPHAEKI